MTRALLSSAASLALLSLSAPAFALTPQEAWDGWKALGEAYGQTVVTESESYTADSLVVRNAAFSIDLPEAEGAVRYTIPELQFDALGDGGVRITMSDSSVVVFEDLGDAEERVSGSAMLTAPDLEMMAMDGMHGVDFTYAGPSSAVTLQELSVNGEAVPLEVTLTTGALSGSYTALPQNGIDSDLGVADLAVAFAADDPEEGRVQGNVQMASVSVTSTSAGGTVLGTDDLGAALRGGLSVEAEIAYGATSAAFEFVDADETGAGTLSMSGGRTVVSMDADALAYDVLYNDWTMALSGSEIPLPSVDVAMGALGVAFRIPLQETATPTDFALRLGLEELSVSDAIWGLIDPAAMLPRDPASLVVDLTGQMRWLADILDPEVMDNDAPPPAELHALDLSELLLRVAGAELTGAGAFTFDNSDYATFDGIPRPEGSLSLRLVGANTLLDTLVQMGLLPQEQAMTARMMSGMLLRPAPEGGDVLISDIEVTPQGQITANGAPLPF